MRSHQPPIYVWQQTTWPQWTYDLETLTNGLAHARQQQGMVIGKAQAVGLAGDYLTSVINQIWIN